MKVEEDAVRLQTHQRMRRSASASLPALNQRDHAVGGFLITSLGRVTLGIIFHILMVEYRIEKKNMYNHFRSNNWVKTKVWI